LGILRGGSDGQIGNARNAVVGVVVSSVGVEPLVVGSAATMVVVLAQVNEVGQLGARSYVVLVRDRSEASVVNVESGLRSVTIVVSLIRNDRVLAAVEDWLVVVAVDELKAIETAGELEWC